MNTGDLGNHSESWNGDMKLVKENLKGKDSFLWHYLLVVGKTRPRTSVGRVPFYSF